MVYETLPRSWSRNRTTPGGSHFGWELELLELEVGCAYQLAAGDPNPPGRKARRRGQLAHEAHVDFDAIEADADRVAATLGSGTLVTRELALEHLVDALRTLNDAPAVLRQLNAAQLSGLAGLPGMLDVVDTARSHAGPLLGGLASRQAARVAAEAAAQGVTTPAVPVPDPAVTAALDAAVQKVATWPASQTLDVARITAAQLAGVHASIGSVIDGIVGAVDSLSTKGPLDVANQVANTATGIGRYAGARSVAAGGGLAVLAYASELLDENTCEECDIVDGTEYLTEAQALADYPGGQYVLCEGGARCRGMLVYIWQAETPASIGLPR